MRCCTSWEAKSSIQRQAREIGNYASGESTVIMRKGSSKEESVEAAFEAEASKNECNEEMQAIKGHEDFTVVNTFDWDGKFSSISYENSPTYRSFSASYVPSVRPMVDLSPLDEELYTRLEQAMADADNSKRKASEELIKRRKAEKYALDAARQAKEAEKMYSDEMSLRKEIENELLFMKDELGKMRNQLAMAIEERNNAILQKSLLEMEMADSEKRAEEFKEKISSAVELLRSYKNQRDELKFELASALRAKDELRFELDSALRAKDELRGHQAECSKSFANLPQVFTEFSYTDILNATRNFQPSLKISEYGNQKIYRGLWRGTEVAVKIIYADSSHGSLDYQQELNVLSRLRHPNIVTLMGACPEANAIVQEYLPNGSLEDRLSCKNNSSPLPWQTRIRIAAEICSALIFLHTSKPECIVHCDLKPSNIFLDANFTCKITDFGTCHTITPDHCSSTGSPTARRILPKGTFAYLDPEFQSPVQPKPTPQLDVYSFGITLLRLLTGRDPWGIAKDVQRGLATGNLNSLLDSSAGDWPYLQARDLIHIALRCADLSRMNRPDLESEVLSVLEPIRASCQGIPSMHRLVDNQPSPAPPYFICPINQDVMQDPQVAADGFTYELEAIQGWLNSGHQTSPMTNLKLAHTKLIPNRALRSAIQEWQHQHQHLTPVHFP